MNTSDKVRFIRYEDLVSNPDEVLKEVYDFIGVEWFNHDLNNIQQSTIFEHDNAYFREKTSHVVKPQLVNNSKSTRNLSQKFHNKVVSEHKWFYDGFYPNPQY